MEEEKKESKIEEKIEEEAESEFDEKAEEEAVDKAEKEIEAEEKFQDEIAEKLDEPVEEAEAEEKAEEEIKKEKKQRRKRTPEEIEERQYRGKRTVEKKEEKPVDNIFALRTTANREDQVMDFIISNVQKKKLEVHSIIRPHGMRSYVFIEAVSKTEAEQAAFNVPYARGILGGAIAYSEIEHMLEQVKVQMNIEKNDIVEIISGPFRRESAKVTRIDRTKEEVVVELLEAAVPIPITLKMDAVKVIRRESAGSEQAEEEEDEY